MTSGSRKLGVALSGAAVGVGLVATTLVLLSWSGGGWGPNDRAWFDDVFWMELLTQALSAGVAAAVAIGLYRRGQRNERLKAEGEREEQRRRGEEERRGELAEEILNVLLDLNPHVLAQTNDVEPIPEAVIAIRDLATQLSRLGARLVGTPFAALPLELGRQIGGWAAFAMWSVRSSPNRPPDLIDYAAQLDEYLDAARHQVGEWRRSGGFDLPAEPHWVRERKDRALLHAEERRARREAVQPISENGKRSEPDSN